MNLIPKLAILAVLPALAAGPLGCETMSEHKVATGTAIGTAAGAVAGGVIGHQSGHRNEGAAIGAGVGALLGAGTGYWLDRRAKRLQTVEDQSTTVQPVPQQTVQTPQGTSQTVPQHVTMRLSDTMLFGQGSSTISAAGDAKLKQIADLLQENTDEQIRVVGYASSEGAEDSNLRLSRSRAEMVTNTLVKYGVSPSRITPIGMGESNPIASNETESGRAQNRRVEIEVFPPAGQ